MIDSTHIKAHRSASGGKKGEQKQAIGRSRGGRNTKIHAIADAKGRLLSILLTGGEAHDCPLAQRLIRRTKAARKLLGDKAYDSAELRQWLNDRGTKPVIPNKSNRKQPFSFDKKILQTTAPHRERLLPPQRLPPHRHALRQAGQKLPCLRLPRRCYRLVDFMSLDPSLVPLHRDYHSLARSG